MTYQVHLKRKRNDQFSRVSGYPTRARAEAAVAFYKQYYYDAKVVEVDNTDARPLPTPHFRSTR